MTRFYYLNRYRILHHRGVRKSIPTDGWVTWSLGRPPKSCRMNLIPVNTIQGSKVTQNMFSYCIGNQSFRGFVNGCFSILLHSPATWAFLWCPCRPRWAPDPEQKSRGQEQKENVLPCFAHRETDIRADMLLLESVSWPRGRSCPSSPSPPPAAWWRFLWLDHVGYASSGVSHSYDGQTRHKSASIVCSHFAVSVQFYYICSINTRVLFFTHPAILLRRGLLGMMAISSHTLLLVWKSLPRRV